MSYEEVIDALSDAAAAQEHTQVIPPHTCPLIDKVVLSVQKAAKMAGKSTKGYEEAELRDLLSDIEWELYGVTDTLEEVRTHNDTLRKLGKAWHAIATDTLRLAGVRHA